MQIGIRPYTRVFELRPCSSEFVAGFEDGEFGVWQRLLDAVGGIDAAEAAADY